MTKPFKARVASRLFNTPLMLSQSKLDVIANAIMPRLDGSWDGEDYDHSNDQRMRAQVVDGVAVIPIHGSLVRRASGMDAMSGVTSYDQIAAMVDAAVADPAASSILLSLDSPGGEVTGLFDLAAKIKGAGKKKRIICSVDDAAFSAGYALASCASEIWVTDTSGVGSIGVVAMHVDQSKADEERGFKVTHVYAGARKVDMNPHAPLSDDARDVLQAEVDRIYGMFVDLVASNRGLSAEAVRAQEAGLFFGAEAAIAAGLADRKGSFEAAMAALRKRSSSTSGVMKMTANTANSTEGGVAETTADVVDLDQVRAQATAAARKEFQEYAQEVAELCELSGNGSMAASLIASGKPVAQIRKELMEAKAKASAETVIFTGHNVVRGNTLAGKDGAVDWSTVMSKASAWRRKASA